MRIYGPRDRKLYTEEERMCRIKRNLALASSYEEFQNGILSCTVTTLKKLGAKKKEITVAEIEKLSKIDLSNKITIGRLFSKYFPGVKTADVYIKREYIAKLRDSAQKDVLILDMLSRHGISNLKELFYSKC